MMYWGNGDWSWTAWMAMSISMVLFWGLIVWAMFSLLRNGTSQERTPLQILDERFAHGDIDEEEYRRRREALRERS